MEDWIYSLNGKEQFTQSSLDRQANVHQLKNKQFALERDLLIFLSQLGISRFIETNQINANPHFTVYFCPIGLLDDSCVADGTELPTPE